MVALICEAGIKVAMLSVPAAQAQTVADQLVEAGVQGDLELRPHHAQPAGGREGEQYRPIDSPATHGILFERAGGVRKTANSMTACGFRTPSCCLRNLKGNITDCEGDRAHVRSDIVRESPTH
jgi:hypothetical protein